MKWWLWVLLGAVGAWGAGQQCRDCGDCASQIVRYVITIDAGSSGTRVHVHHYWFQPDDSIPKFNPKSATLKIRPGLSSFKDDTFSAGSSLLALLDFARDNIPQPLWKLTPVYLKATAGLRSIPKDAAEKILESCRGILQKSGFRFKDIDAEIITGTEEAVLGWVATNYLFERLSKTALDHPVGLLEMGGASLQVSFIFSEAQSKSSFTAKEREFFQNVKIGAKKFEIYTHSFLGYGLESAQGVLAEHIKSNNVGVAKPQNPCYPKDVEFQGTLGSGDFDECYEMIELILKKDAPCSSTCSFNGVFQPHHADAQFIAIENFFYTAEFFKVLSSGTSIFDDMKSAGREFCKLSFSTIQEKYETERDPANELKKYCFSAAYIPKLLESGFGFKDPGSKVKVVRIVNGAAIDWALGSVILEVSGDGSLIPSQWKSPDDVEDENEDETNEGLNPLMPPFPTASTTSMLFVLGAVGVVLLFLKWRSWNQRGAQLDSMVRSAPQYSSGQFVKRYKD